MRRSWFRAALAITLAVLCGSCARQDGRVHITLQRFFGACDAAYGKSADVASAEGECGIMTALMNRFRADNPDIDLTVNVVFWPGYDQLTSQLAANDAPDLVTIHASVLPDYQSRGLLEPLNADLVAAGVDPAGFTAAAGRGVTIEGKVWGMPIDSWGMLWHYNMNLMRRAGLVKDGRPVTPHSVDELLAQAEQFQARTGKPFLVQVTTNDFATYARNLYNLLIQQNSGFFDDPRHIRLQTPEARNVLRMFKAIHDRRLSTVNQDYSASMSTFLNGGGGVLLGGTWMVGDFDLASRKPGSPLYGGYAATPYPQLFPQRKAVLVDSHSLAMPVNHRRTPAQKQAALRLLKFMADNDYHWSRTGHMPAFAAVLDSKAFQALPQRAHLTAMTTTGTLLPTGVRRQFPIQIIIGEEARAAINGLKSIDQALADAEKRINTLLDNT
ncbi:MAG: extracellular solute-binding protein [Caulobacteraceae bacterium]